MAEKTIMGGKLTRRKFIKTTMSVGCALVVFPGFQPDCITSTNCENCGIHGQELVSSASFRLLKKRFCPNCGINLYTNSFSIDKKCDCGATVSGILKKKKESYPPCCQVPFPDNSLATNTNKPVFNISDLKF